MTDTIAFTRGVPPPESFPVEKLVQCASAILQREAHVILQYAPAAGYEPLRAWLADHHHCASNQVLIGQGSLQLLDILVRVTLSSQDFVFVEQPSYDRALTIFRRGTVRLRGVPLIKGVLDMDYLEARLISGEIPRYFYLIPDFQNPSGSVLSLDQRERLIHLSGAYNFLIIEDGPYRQLRYCGESLPTLYELAPQQVLHMSSFSKLISPGLRVGYMILSHDLAQIVKKYAEDTYINSSYLNQAIAFEFIQRGWLQQNILELQELYHPRLDAALDALKNNFRDLADWVEPQGGFFVGLELKSGWGLPSDEIIQQAGLQFSDSRAFFVNGGGNFIRLPFCALTPAQIKLGLQRLQKITEKRIC